MNPLCETVQRKAIERYFPEYLCSEMWLNFNCVSLRRHTIPVFFQSRGFHCIPRISLYPAGIIRSQTVSTFWRQLGLTNTRGLDLMRLAMRFSFMQELCITLAKWSCAGWVTSVLMPCEKCMHVDKLNPFEQSTLELWAATLFRVRKFNFASDLITSFFCFRMCM